GALGLLLPQPLPEALMNPYLCELMRGIGQVCEERGLVLTMLPPIRGKAEEAARRAAVDAVLTIGIGPWTEVVEILIRRHLPFATIDGLHSGPVSNIGIDDEGASNALMSHVLDLGHRRIGILQLTPELHSVPDERYSPTSIRRLAGFRRALAGVGIELGGDDAPVVIAGGSFEGGSKAAEALMRSQQRPLTALVAMSDIIALGAYDALRRGGLSVPEDVSVAGFDDIPLSSRVSPTLTTVRQPGFEKGVAAASLVLAILEGGAADHRLLPAELVKRESTSSP
ncbi:MAG: substrate-binding domain-containing protein, partial [Spirochaetota bacterium]